MPLLAAPHTVVRENLQVNGDVDPRRQRVESPHGEAKVHGRVRVVEAFGPASARENNGRVPARVAREEPRPGVR